MMRGSEGDVSMSPVQIELFVRAAVSMFVNWEDTFLQHRAGTIDASGMESDVAMMRTFFSIPGYRAVWTTVQRQFSARFREYIGAMMREQKSHVPRRDLSTAWKAHVLDELAQAKVATAGP